ncbi:MAG: hypothetical protein K9W42_13085 [Candidatus Heimdallarchaeota archaeon]|nr:hypothetical protein [Candidatus Heimdallarchaeota archaeon]
MDVYPVKFIVERFGEALGEFYRMKAPLSVEEIWYSLPISGRARIEDNAQLYFLTDIQVKAEHPTLTIEPGDIAYCPLQKSIHVFWAQTTPVAEVNIIGKITKNLEMFKEVKSLSRVVLQKH